MSAAQFAAATGEFDRGRPRRVAPSRQELAKHEAAMRPSPPRRRGRPRLGGGAVRVLFSIDPALLLRIDTFARSHGMKRSHLIAEAAEMFIRAKAGSAGRKRAGLADEVTDRSGSPVLKHKSVA